LEEVSVCAGEEVLMEVDNNMLLIVGDSEGIFRLSSYASPIALNLFYNCSN